MSQYIFVDEVCKRIRARLFFNKKTLRDTIYYKHKHKIVVTDRQVTSARVSQFIELLGLDFD